ncbi:MAG: hypothetical protein E7147_04290 [Rikenellaceae bacterium]|nr:hypothetical protein [Rikenellaceae bacterium]
MRTQFTKDVSVERVIPPALLDYTEGVGTSEMKREATSAHEFDYNEKRRWRTELFVRYAYRLLRCSEQIFADERLFYTPLPLPLSGWERQGLAYEVQHTELTLGHIIDWWQNYKCSQVVDEAGKRHYIYGFEFGTQCKFGHRPSVVKPDRVKYVGDDGKSYTIECASSLLVLGNSLYEVCKRYPHPPHKGVFDIEDAVELLLGERCYTRF